MQRDLDARTIQATGGVTFAALFPHPPILVPAIGRARLADCRPTYDACRELARRVVAARPRHIVLPTPHAPRHDLAFGLRRGPRVRGDLERFGAPECTIDLPSDPAMTRALLDVRDPSDPPVVEVQALEPLDHGASVPLRFLLDAGWDGPTTIMTLPWTSEPRTFEAFGRLVGRAADRLPGPTAVVASGDMSHRVLPEAPAGHHPRAVEFDHALTDIVRSGRLREMLALDPALRELAAEDAADTAIMAAASTDWSGLGHEVLSYEHPFGVGYLVAVFYDQIAGADGA